MNLTLRRNQFSLYGVFGQLLDSSNSLVAVTLEHAFLAQDHSFYPKIPNGTYLCVRGMHSLDHHPAPFETFEITGIPGHTGLLVHWGNYNRDSDGCILLGARVGAGCILDSKFAFDRFMDSMTGIDQFSLTVS